MVRAARVYFELGERQSIGLHFFGCYLGENRREPYNTSVNPAGQTPALELDDGSHLTEIIAICEYLEERQPSPPLIGTTAAARAVTRMWTRRVDLKVCEPMANGFRYADSLPLFQTR